MSDAELPYELMATNDSVIVRVTLPGDVEYDAEFSLSPAGITSVAAHVLPQGALKVQVLHDGITIVRIVPLRQLPDFRRS